jgi:hypothetical protein
MMSSRVMTPMQRDRPDGDSPRSLTARAASSGCRETKAMCACPSWNELSRPKSDDSGPTHMGVCVRSVATGRASAGLRSKWSLSSKTARHTHAQDNSTDHGT